MIDQLAPAAFDIGGAFRAEGAGIAPLRTIPGAASAQAKPTDFGTVLAQMAVDAVGVMKTGEATAITGIQGKASVQEVVESVMAAEQTLQSMIAIRDKVVSAYLELSRMAI